MISCIKKSFLALIYNCHISLTLALYLICFVFFIARVFFVSDILIFASLLFFFFIFSLLFFSGWFNAISHVLKEDNDKNFFELFKCGVREYFLPFLNSILLFLLVFALINFLGTFIADKFIGKIDFMWNIVGIEKYSLDSFLSSLSSEQIEILFKRELLFIVCAFLMHAMTLFWVPAIYSKKNLGKTSFNALSFSCRAFFKKPVVTMGLTLFSNIVILSFLFAPHVFMSNIYFLLLDIVIFSCWAVFILMLIFSYYEKTFENNCDNGADSIGQE